MDPAQLAFGVIPTSPDGVVERVSLSELDRGARRLATRLREDAQPGARVLLISRDVVQHVRSLLACWYAGMTPVSGIPPHPPRAAAAVRHAYRLARLRHVIANAGVSVILAEAELLAPFRLIAQSALAEAPATWIASDGEGGAPMVDRVAPAPNDLALIQYTSGSTAGAKGVMLSHGNLMHNLAAQTAAMALTPADVGVSWLPAHHDMGLIGTGLLPLCAGLPYFIMAPEQFAEDPLRWLRTISDLKATISWGPNSAFAMCAARATAADVESLDLSRWRCALNGSEPVQAIILEAFAERFASAGFSPSALRPAFGLAEATLVVSGGSPSAPPAVHWVARDDLARKMATPAPGAGEGVVPIVACGATLPGMEVRIVDPDRLEAVPEGAIGEIWCRGPSIAQGYWDNPEETARVFGGRVGDAKEIYLRTGDLGFIWGGQLHFTGRLKDLLILRGANYYPQDVEFIVEQSDPGFEPNGSAAFTLDEDGEQKLVVVAEVHRRSEAQADQLIARARRAVFDETGLEVGAIVLVRRGAMTKTPSGKLQRRACQTAFETEGLHAVGAWRQTEDPAARRFAAELARRGRPDSRVALKSAVREISDALLGRDAFEGGGHFVDLGVNSIGLVEFALDLRRIYGVRIKAAELHEVASLERFCDLLWARLEDASADSPPSPRSEEPRAATLSLLLKLAERTGVKP